MHKGEHKGGGWMLPPFRGFSWGYNPLPTPLATNQTLGLHESKKNSLKIYIHHQ